MVLKWLIVLKGVLRMKIEKDEMDELIDESNGDQLVILIRMKTLNQKAAFHMKTPGKTFKQNYRSMWSKPFWKEARQLLKEYFTLENNGIFQCGSCKKSLDSKFVLHHYQDFYKGSFRANTFTPLYIQLICNSCNYKEHKEGK